MAKILIVEDDRMVQMTLQRIMQEEGHIAEVCGNGEDCIQLVANFSYDLILLDWSLPKMSGFQTCSKIRQLGVSSWIIFCTGKSGVEEKTSALDAGADDYIVKPFNTQELTARVRKVFRRPHHVFQPELGVAGMTLDVSSNTINFDGISVRLMPKESALLEFFIRNPKQLFTIKQLLVAVWPSESEVTEGNVRVYLTYLRQKLQQLGRGDIIKNVPGAGYKIDES